MEHLNNNNLVDLKCNERETAQKEYLQPIVKSCPCCEQERSYYDFWYFIGKTKQESKICCHCFRELRQLDLYLARTLDGVKIPVYEKPITKYPIT